VVSTWKMEQAQSENTKDFSLTQYQKTLKEPMPEKGACALSFKTRDMKSRICRVSCAFLENRSELFKDGFWFLPGVHSVCEIEFRRLESEKNDIDKVRC